jgi:hypothetical protein
MVAAGLADARISRLELFGRRAAAAAVEHWTRDALRAGRSFAPDGHFPRPGDAAAPFQGVFLALQPALAARSAALIPGGFREIFRPRFAHRCRADFGHALAGHQDCRALVAALAERLAKIRIDLRRGLACAARPLLAPLRGPPDDFAEAAVPDSRGPEFSREQSAALAYLLPAQEEELLQIGRRDAVLCAARLGSPDLLAFRDPPTALAHRCVRGSVPRDQVGRLALLVGPLPAAASPKVVVGRGFPARRVALRAFADPVLASGPRFAGRRGVSRSGALGSRVRDAVAGR